MKQFITEAIGFIAWWITALSLIGGLLFAFQWILLELVCGNIIKAAGHWKLMIEFVYHRKKFIDWKNKHPEEDFFVDKKPVDNRVKVVLIDNNGTPYAEGDYLYIIKKNDNGSYMAAGPDGEYFAVWDYQTNTGADDIDWELENNKRLS